MEAREAFPASFTLRPRRISPFAKVYHVKKLLEDGKELPTRYRIETKFRWRPHLPGLFLSTLKAVRKEMVLQKYQASDVKPLLDKLEENLKTKLLEHLALIPLYEDRGSVKMAQLAKKKFAEDEIERIKQEAAQSVPFGIDSDTLAQYHKDIQEANYILEKLAEMEKEYGDKFEENDKKRIKADLQQLPALAILQLDALFPNYLSLLKDAAEFASVMGTLYDNVRPIYNLWYRSSQYQLVASAQVESATDVIVRNTQTSQTSQLTRDKKGQLRFTNSPCNDALPPITAKRAEVQFCGFQLIADQARWDRVVIGGKQFRPFDVFHSRVFYAKQYSTSPVAPEFIALIMYVWERNGTVSAARLYQYIQAAPRFLRNLRTRYDRWQELQAARAGVAAERKKFSEVKKFAPQALTTALETLKLPQNASLEEAKTAFRTQFREAAQKGDEERQKELARANEVVRELLTPTQK